MNDTDTVVSLGIVKSEFLISIHNPAGERLVGISPDGKVTYGPNYTPDEAARTFWEAIANFRCPKCMREEKGTKDG